MNIDYDFMQDITEDMDDYIKAENEYNKQIDKACLLAKQVYKNEIKHFEHAERVVLRMKELCGLHYEIIIAYLHDVLVNTHITYDSLVRLFGVHVADGVKALNDTNFDNIINYETLDLLTIKLVVEIDNVKNLRFYTSDERHIIAYINKIKSFITYIESSGCIATYKLYGDLIIELKNEVSKILLKIQAEVVI